MKILRLQAENLKRLSAVEITPQGNLVRISGKNDQGKSSVLDAILFALAGERAIEWEPVKRGEERATITLDLGDDANGLKLRIIRRFTAKSGEQGSKPYTTSLVVEDADGRRPKGPQALLDAIVGAIAFDPLEFSRMDDKAKVHVLRELVTGVDFDAIAERRRQAFEERTFANRKANEAKTRASGIIVPPQAPEQPVDVGALTARLAAISEAATAREREAGHRASAQAEIGGIEKRLIEIAEALERLQQEAVAQDAKRSNILRGMAAWDDLPEVEDPAPIKAALDSAHELNAAYAKAQQREQVTAEALEWEAKARELTAAIEEADSQVAKAVQDANLPVRGLTFDQDGVYLNDLPFGQAASSLQLRASMAIAMAMNPKLRVLRIKEGALLDEEAMNVLAAVAEADDFQMWVERISDDAPAAIQIEDGRVKA